MASWCYEKLNAGERYYWNALAEAAVHDPLVFGRDFLDKTLLTERQHGPLFDFLVKGERRRDIAINRHNVLPMSLYGTDWTGMDTGACKYARRETRLIGVDWQRQMIREARSSLKTTCVGEVLPPWLLIRNPDEQILLAGETLDHAKRTLKAITLQLRNNPKLIHYWHTDEWFEKSPRWTETEAISGGRTRIGRDLSLHAVGVQAFHPGQHYTHAVVDDIISKESVESDVECENVADFFAQLSPVLDPPRRLWVIGTPWARYDIYQTLADLEASGKPQWELYTRSVYNPDGSLWWPERFSQEYIDQLIAENTLRPWVVWSQYFMQPLSAGETKLGEPLWDADEMDADGKYTKLPSRDKLNVIISIDPADPRGEGSGAWAVWCMGTDADEGLWDLCHLKARTTGDKVTDEVIAMAKQWKPDIISIECTTISKTYITSDLEPQLRKAGVRCAVNEVFHGGESKIGRIKSVENGLGLFIARNKFHARSDNYALKSELNVFPKPNNTYDLLDAGAYAARTASDMSMFPRKTVPPPKPVEKNPEDEAIDAQLKAAWERNNLPPMSSRDMMLRRAKEKIERLEAISR